MERYNFKLIENKWQKFWESEKTFQLNEKIKNFLFLSHVRNSYRDVLARYKYYKVIMFYIQWDGFFREQKMLLDKIILSKNMDGAISQNENSLKKLDFQLIR